MVNTTSLNQHGPCPLDQIASSQMTAIPEVAFKISTKTVTITDYELFLSEGVYDYLLSLESERFNASNGVHFEGKCRMAGYTGEKKVWIPKKFRGAPISMKAELGSEEFARFERNIEEIKVALKELKEAFQSSTRSASKVTDFSSWTSF